MWTSVRAAGLDILRTSMSSAVPEDLDRLILSTGYPWALDSAYAVSDLMATYAASLRNGGGPGPSSEAFSKMIAVAVQPFIVDNCLVQTLDSKKIAQACVDYLGQPESLRLTVSGTVDYFAELKVMAAGRPIGRPRALIPQLIRSIIEFSEVLMKGYGGSAAKFHDVFNRVCESSGSAIFVLNRFKEVSQIPRVGVALAMNFFKDSQVPALRQQSLGSLYENQIGWFVKPDIHVLRFMLKITGRSLIAGISDEKLVYMKEGDVRRAYASIRPTPVWAGGNYTYCLSRPSSEIAQWCCIEDVHRLARCQNISPLEIDRILFMIGSGKFYGEGRISLAQQERYRSLFKALDSH